MTYSPVVVMSTNAFTFESMMKVVQDKKAAAGKKSAKVFPGES